MGFVGKNDVESVAYFKSVGHRFYLRMTLLKKDYQQKNSEIDIKECVLVIMKNPSTTCDNLDEGIQIFNDKKNKRKSHTDKTTTNVLKKIKQGVTITSVQGGSQSNIVIFKKIIVLNLYSFYYSKSSGVDAYYYGTPNLPPLFAVNNSILEHILSKYKGDVICAWGDNSKIRKVEYDNQVKSIQQILSNNTNLNLLKYDTQNRNFIDINNTIRNNPTTPIYPEHGFNWK